MAQDREAAEDLARLNQIAEALNKAVDVRSALDFALQRVVEVMGLETGWIFLRDDADQDKWAGRGYSLAAHLNLPPALELDRLEPWIGGCDCQGFCNTGKLTEAYNEVRCTRLAEASGDRRSLAVHASAPLRSGANTLGILNVAAPDWESFRPEKLALLSNVGSQIGVALERARLYDLLRDRRIHEQQALLALSNQLLGRLNLPDVLDYLVGEITTLLQADACLILLHERDTNAPGALVARAGRGWQVDPVGRAWPAQKSEAEGRGLVNLGRLRPLGPIPGDLPDAERKLLAAEGFQSAAVAPLVSGQRDEERSTLGALLLFCREERSMAAEEKSFFQLLANQAALAIEKAHLHEAELARQRLESELDFGRQIQLAMLPPSLPELEGWEFAAHYRPARQVGGDFYDFFTLGAAPGFPPDAALWGLVVADVADKGLPAAIFMALSRAMIRTTAPTGLAPAQALEQANALIYRDGQGALFLSAFYACLDPQTGRFQFTNAGHNRPLWLQAGMNEVTELATPGVVLGVFPEVSLGQGEIVLGPGDLLVCFTDGVTEAMDGSGNLLGAPRLRAVLAQQSHRSAREALEAVLETVDTFTRGAPAEDDLTVLAIRRTPLA